MKSTKRQVKRVIAFALAVMMLISTAMTSLAVEEIPDDLLPEN